MQSGHIMNTVSEVVEMLRKEGYIEDFGMTKHGFAAGNSHERLSPDQIKIRKVFRFEGDSDPDDMSVIFAMETADGVKGILIDAYGTYAGNESEELSEFLKRVIIEEETI